jgi:hypothetical protein
MPARVEWRRIRRGHCAPDNAGAIALWTDRGRECVGLGVLGIVELLGCSHPQAQFLRYVVNDLGLTEPPDAWPRGYAEPGPYCSDPIATGADSRYKVERKGDEDVCHINVQAQELITNLDDLVRVAGIDLLDWRIDRHKVNTWPTSMKGADGQPKIVRNWQVTAHLERRMVAREDGPIVVAATEYAAPEPVDHTAGTVLVVPDSQHGFRWSERRDRLTPMHDRRACDVVLQLAREVQPEVILLLGDMLDLAEWSTKFPRPSDLRDTTQISLAALHWWIAQMRIASPLSRIVYLEGNHEARIDRLLIEKAGHAATLRAVGDDLPALSVRRLLALDSLGVEYVQPYGEWWYLGGDGLTLGWTHGDKVRSGGGATVQAVVKEAHHSVGFGHIHRVEMAHRAVYGRHGRRDVVAYSPGCLCDPEQTPGATHRKDWQQGVALHHYDLDAGREAVELLTIRDGWTVYGGRQIVGRDYGAQVAEATGWGQVG